MLAVAQPEDHSTGWTPASIASELLELDRRAEPDPAAFSRGAEVYLKAGCDRCHGAEPTTPDSHLAPTLARLLYRYSASEVLDHVVDPNLFVDKRYHTEVVELRGGTLRDGLLLEETDTHLLLLPNPLEPALRQWVAKAVIKHRHQLEVSPMPENLLEPFAPPDVVALLTYLLFAE